MFLTIYEKQRKQIFTTKTLYSENKITSEASSPHPCGSNMKDNFVKEIDKERKIWV